MLINPVSPDCDQTDLFSRPVFGSIPTTVILTTFTLTRRILLSASPLCYRWAKTNGKPVDQHPSMMQGGTQKCTISEEKLNQVQLQLELLQASLDEVMHNTRLTTNDRITDKLSWYISGGFIARRSALSCKAPS